ncbi:MAG: Hpt domain-containing protein [SAR202 cluster bacterium Casp-Chloro-G3]|nr:MAG: Hpt domain-containing protein [SAR202 cluster bacterium Casp-Chloro-G3]
MTQNFDNLVAAKITVRVDPDIADLIPGYLKNLQEDMGSILGSLEQGDYETVRILSHSMKGSGGGYGFDAITDIGNSLELAAKEQDATVIRNMVNQLTNYLKQVEIVYDE